jgi:hypothetical protein
MNAVRYVLQRVRLDWRFARRAVVRAAIATATIDSSGARSGE